ncbi:hypothetical protein [Prochlorococcus sp. MIT 1306]|uniref:hypothetical protein n=1 Tax=Prochlorococcus sp. MIT 1306 TaxID=1799667 RepID=UPI0007B34738|nr:hypothetical protein [Prochlorococcus sp. MIT 1306]KZR61555.1 hypothetical protein PMIT1306_02337 [Prochlorococcus sp. MIT 1306]
MLFWRRFGLGVVVILVCVAFALKALLLVDVTSLWSDELYSVGKSFQPSFRDLLAMLRNDTHPPVYYSLLWFWGQSVGQNAVTLRLLSWLAYGLGGIVMVFQAGALAQARGVSRGRSLCLAALLAFCSPYPVRFAIEGKSYALLVLFVGLAWWWRRRLLQSVGSSTVFARDLLLYGITVCLAALTHFYGLFLFVAAAAWDLWQQRWRLGGIATLALLPALVWIAYAATYLFRDSTGGWLAQPGFALLEETLARALGPWPFPKIGLFVLLMLALRRWGRLSAGHDGDESHRRDLQPAVVAGSLLDQSGLIPSALMLLAVVAVSFVKPLAFSRYFVVLVPAALPLIAVKLGGLRLNLRGSALALVALTALTVLWWQQSYIGLHPGLGSAGGREQDNFRAISQSLAGQVERYGRRSRLLNLSDHMEVAAGRMLSNPMPWGDDAALQKRLDQPPLPSFIWLASSGPDQSMRRRLKPLIKRAEQGGYTCREDGPQIEYTRVLRCTLTTSSVGDSQ